ncbi:MAG: hypothetical protein QME75_11455 [Deltaproteobacteria bacterium]|nr:hypothetical protein [Deltaproteobacteria bacterium]
MQVFIKNELKDLAAARPGPCISIYMPTHRVPMEIQQDRLRLKNLLRKSEESLTSRGLRSPEAKKLLDPAEKLLGHMVFWKGQQDGLAIFLAPEFERLYPLPVDFPELVVVGERFHLKPLLKLLGGGELYILALSQNEVRFFQASRFSVSEVEVEGMPRSLAEALKYDEPQKQLQFHTGTQKTSGDRPAIFHGHGVGTDDSKSNLLRFFQQVDRSLHSMLREEQAPLVLAGVDYLLPIYHEANSYSNLLQEGLTGSPEGLSAAELHQRACAVVQPYFQRLREEAAAKYRQLAGTGKASHDLKEIVPAAYHGRVESLFVAVGQQVWGSFEAATADIRLLEKEEPGSQDLMDVAAIHTLMQGGQVFSVEAGQVPDGPPAAAVFRY